MTKVAVLFGINEIDIENTINLWIQKHSGTLIQDIKLTASRPGYLYAMIIYKVLI